ncbi:Glycosyltransferase involved in cell wall bisynthesis [Rhizobium sp. NFR07]|uniref:glycosyltransferase n=1 Tax=Rhizobium sp. NFR07 TaxID=1566262 RepID=UPI0008E0BA0F|nr:glycosyltransferase [Rhizobium sp. NFR07]SFB62864.1 Glycosyltransferase involved in cell wall bisynthesis [Rhizobium sp. NFR07]
MRVAFISTIPIFPLSGGNRARQWTLIREIKALGHEVDFIFLPSRQQGEYRRDEHLEFLGAEHFHELKRQGLRAGLYLGKRAAYRIFRALARGVGAPISSTHFLDEIYYHPFSSQIRRLNLKHDYDAAIVTYIWFSSALRSLPSHVYKVIDTHDSFAQVAGDNVEATALKRADAVVAIQEQEAEVFKQQLEQSDQEIFTISHIVPSTTGVCPVDNLGATFIGSSFAANRQSIHYFLNDVLPLILKRRPNFKLLVCGTICNDIPDHPNVEKLHFVADLKQAFRRAPISINPITAGTGVKIKLLESMAHGVPVVSTKKGMEGLDLQDLQGVTVVDDYDPQAFANAVLALFDNVAQQTRSSEAARRAALNWNKRQRTSLQRLLASAAREQR